ncbi:flavodoxin [Paenibacillus stellifer]|uniref:Flavodoxin n=1 Tax=Paenibacillus stellifer TaxID=169760 RepID=A0A089MZI1_9BACL|nr:NAD(P)H-dependent oxidoreductase [Paenibacillus stellifer]AIQ61809.1 flavodoxin [Paenibacillus stellifer]
MKNFLVINGHQQYAGAEGRLNQTLADTIAAELSERGEVRTTTVQHGYDIEEERKKFLWADLVIFQTPIYWFSVPGLMKTYMDEVYAPGTFFEGAGTYGRGGLLTGTKYMFSTTWNAPAQAFGDPGQFFKGDGLEEAIRHLHRVQEYVGMKPLRSYACYDVIKNPRIEDYVAGLRRHLKEVLTGA